MTDSVLQVFNDRRFRIAAGICGALLMIFSMTLLGLSSRPMHPASTMVVSVLPDTPYKLPILRSLPEPQPMLPKAHRVKAYAVTNRLASLAPQPMLPKAHRVKAAPAKTSPMFARRRY